MNMKSFIVYAPNGKIEKTGSCLDVDFYSQNIEGYSIIEGQADQLTQYIENLAIKNMPQKPDENSVFDFDTKQWVENFDALIAQILSKRNLLLLQSDWTQLPNNPLTSEKQQSWATYRQLLRDIPQQSGYPLNVVWPQQPE